MSRAVKGLVAAGVIALLVWAIPLAPQKDVIVITQEIPLTADERAQLGYEQEALTAYSVYYVWDGEQEQHPWWSIFQSRLHGFDWIVIETRAVGDLDDIDGFGRAWRQAYRFDEDWFDHHCFYIQRTRLEKIQHALFGGGRYSKERAALDEILALISSGED